MNHLERPSAEPCALHARPPHPDRRDLIAPDRPLGARSRALGRPGRGDPRAAAGPCRAFARILAAAGV